MSRTACTEPQCLCKGDLYINFFYIKSARFKFLIKVTLNIEDFWDLTPCRQVNSYRRFEKRNFQYLSINRHGLTYQNIQISKN
jgi:hypothetical protein